jgi:hypothetical protein
MNRMYSLVSFLTLCLCITSLSPRPVTGQGSQPSLTEKDVPGWTVEKPDSYNANQLFGYINGGAELYLEYGFKRVTAWRCVKQKQEFVADVYEMATPAAAFGMWSISKRNCPSTLPKAKWSCITDNQILFVRGAHLVNITLFDRSGDTRQTARKAAEALLSRIRGKDHTFPQQLTTRAMTRHTAEVRLFQGPLAVQGSIPNWGGFLEGIQRFDLHHLSIGTGRKASEAGLLRFRSPRDLDRFSSAAGFKRDEIRQQWGLSADKSRAMKILEANSAWFILGGNVQETIKTLDR